MEPTPQEVANVTRALRPLRSAPAAWRPVLRGGYTPARRWVVTLEDGRSVFGKAASDELTASWIRDEHVTYSMLRGASFMPGYVGFHDDGEHPVLVLEDLSDAEWPPPWDERKIRSVLDCLELVAATPPPAGLPQLDDDHLELRGGWREIERDPAPFLSLGLCSEGWLRESLPSLDEVASSAPLGGDALLHVDVRSDNLCFRADGSAVLVDWNWTSVGNPSCDPVFWLASLRSEGGPEPEEVVPDAPPGLVSCVAGFLCSRAGLEPIPTAPRVREVQLVQARVALPWVARALGLPHPG